MGNFNHSAKRACQVLGLGLLLLYVANSQADSAPDQRQRTYQADRQRCLSGQSEQDQASCLQEAGAVLQQMPRDNSPVSAAQLQENARQRCAALPDATRPSCLARMEGQGRTEGSAAAGGVYRELSEPVPSTDLPPQPLSTTP
jgi:hypothetical protein